MNEKNNIREPQVKKSIILKILVIIAAVVGTILSVYDRAAFMSGYRVFMYFTIQSNIAIAIISAIGLYYIKSNRSGNVWEIIKFVGTVSITLTGFVFCFVLAPTLGDEAWKIKNILTHVVVPIGAVADFFVIGQSFNIKTKSVLFIPIPPIIYAIYAGIGYILGWNFSKGNNYPYFFLNWGSPAGAFGFANELPFMGCIWWILALLVFLILVGFLYLWILEVLRRRSA